MDTILKLIRENIDLILLVLYLISVFIAFLRTNDIKKLKEDLDFMKYRLPSYSEGSKVEGRSFDKELPQYVLDENTNTLKELPVKKKIQDEINSFRDVDLTESIDRLMPVKDSMPNDIDNTVDMYRYNFDRLDAFREAQQFKEELIEKYGLAPDMSLDDAIKTIEAEQNSLLKQMQEYQNGGYKDASKKTKEADKQENL